MNAKSTSEIRLATALQDLFANMLRVSRSSGKPDILERQLAAVANQIDAYQAEHGRAPSVNGYRRMLAFDRRRLVDPPYQEIVSGSFQIAASLFLDEEPQLQRGVLELENGLRELRFWMENRSDTQ